jgi:hypothetical protein
MERIGQYVGETLQWCQPRLFASEYELRCGDVVVATLDFRSAFGTHATAESADGRWTFKRVGFWRTRVTVRNEGGDDDVAVFENETWSGGGTLRFANGTSYQASTNFWTTRWEFQTAGEVPLVRFHTHGLARVEADVELQADAAHLAALPLMVMLGWYLVVMLHRDSAATAVIVS